MQENIILNSISQESKPKINTKIIIIGVTSGLLLILVVAIIIVFNSNASIQTPDINFITPTKIVDTGTQMDTGTDTHSTQILSQKPIRIIGKESIYQRNYEYYAQAYPKESLDANTKELIMDAITNDSILLQGASEDGFANVDDTIFNSKNLDPLKRIKMVSTIKKLIQNQEDTITGAVIVIWFYNEWIGPKGYDANKSIAYQKIVALHNAVKKKKMTIQQAGEAIVNDSTLAEIDKAYKINAIKNFTVNRDTSITIITDLDRELWKLNEGEVSNIYVNQGMQPDPSKPIPPIDSDGVGTSYVKIDQLYAFGQVTSQKKGKIRSYEEWFNNKKKSYSVVVQ
ncbi:MAG: hypothetical protein WCO06_06100 [Candidatus Roizmanbacteria bacterium]